MRKAIIGDVQTISLDFTEAEPGDVFSVRVVIKGANGRMKTEDYQYLFYAPIERQA